MRAGNAGFITGEREGEGEEAGQREAEGSGGRRREAEGLPQPSQMMIAVGYAALQHCNGLRPCVERLDCCQTLPGPPCWD